MNIDSNNWQYVLYRVFVAFFNIRLTDNPMSYLHFGLLMVLGLTSSLISLNLVAEVFELYKYGEPMGTNTASLVALVIMFTFSGIFGALMIRNLILEIRSRLNLNKNLIIYESTLPDLDPVEAGYFIDGSWSSHEASAILFGLYTKGVTHFENGLWHLTGPRPNDLNPYEKFFILEFFSNNDYQILGQHNLAAGVPYQTYDSVKQSVASKGYAAKNLTNIIVFIITRVSIVFAIAMTYITYLAVREGGSSMLSPSSDGFTQNVTWLEVAIVAAIPASYIITIISGFLSNHIYKNYRLDDWRKVAGLKIYINQALKDKFIAYNQVNVSQKEFYSLYPYALAFGLVTLRDFEYLIESGKI